MYSNEIKTVDFLFPEENLRERNNLGFPNSECNNFLYHYTNIEAALSIIESGSIWLTDYKGLNDKSEGELLYKELKKNTSNKKDKEKIENDYSLLTQNTFVSSFSSYGNLLTLWRGYGRVALGFDYCKLLSRPEVEDKNGVEYQTSGLIRQHCRYLDDNEIKKYAQIVLARGKSTLTESYDLLTIGSDFFDVKHPAFIDEREIRILCYLYNKNPHISDTGKKYIKLNFDTDALKRIVVGPSKEQKQDEHKFHEMKIEVAGLKNIEIYRSTIPYVDTKIC